MGKIYDNFLKIGLENNKNSDAQLIYTLVAIETDFHFRYTLKRGHSYNQFWLYSKDESVVGTAILLQASQEENGNVLLSIQGLYNKFPTVKNFIDYDNLDEHDIFMKYLQLF